MTKALVDVPITESEAVQAGRASLRLGGFIVGVNGLAVQGEPSWESSAQLGRTLGSVRRGFPMAIGDFVNWLEATFGEKASQVVDYETLGEERSIMVWRWVAEKVPLAVRRLTELTFAHHQAVAVLAPEEQAAWLERAIISEWTVSELTAELRRHGAVAQKTKPLSFWLMVQCRDSADREALQERLTREGRTCKIK